MVKQETILTFYGGVNEIGGNKILLKDGDRSARKGEVTLIEKGKEYRIWQHFAVRSG